MGRVFREARVSRFNSMSREPTMPGSVEFDYRNTVGVMGGRHMVIEVFCATA